MCKVFSIVWYITTIQYYLLFSLSNLVGKKILSLYGILYGLSGQHVLFKIECTGLNTAHMISLYLYIVLLCTTVKEPTVFLRMMTSHTWFITLYKPLLCYKNLFKLCCVSSYRIVSLMLHILKNCLSWLTDNNTTNSTTGNPAVGQGI